MDALPFTLRPALETDHDGIAGIWHESASLPGVGPALMPTPTELRERIGREIAGGWVVTIAVRDREIIGFVAVTPHRAVLNEIFVRPASIGRGIGKALLDCAKRTMPQGFVLYTRATNMRARRFYEQAGLTHFLDGIHPSSGDPVAHYAWKMP
jgi:putative acetyltransferase